MQGSAAIAGAGGRIEELSNPPAAQITPPPIPALYLVALALVAGDLAGSLRIGLPVWIAIAAGSGAAAAFLRARVRLAMTMALAALAAAACVAAQRVYAPPAGTQTIRSFQENPPIVFEGRLYREPEHLRDILRL